MSGFPLPLIASATDVFTEANSFDLGQLAKKQTAAISSGAEKRIRSVQRLCSHHIALSNHLCTLEVFREKLLERGKGLAAPFFALGLVASLALAAPMIFNLQHLFWFSGFSACPLPSLPTQ